MNMYAESVYKEDCYTSHLSLELAEGLEFYNVMRCMYTVEVVVVTVMWSAL